MSRRKNPPKRHPRHRRPPRVRKNPYPNPASPELKKVLGEVVGSLYASFVGNRLEAFKDCVCKGECPCHSGVQIVAVPCPPGCPNRGHRFDGCHRCDCGSTARKEK